MSPDRLKSSRVAFTARLFSVKLTRIFRRCLLLLCPSLVLLFWFGLLDFTWVTSPAASPAAPNAGLRGYARIKPDEVVQFLDLHCHRCAVVSSSGQMLGTGAGEEIDQSGCVIRMNNAPTRGFERNVGSRTRVRVVSHTSVPLLVKNEKIFFQESADTVYVFWGPQKSMTQDGTGKIFNILMRIAKKYPRTQLFAMTPDKMQYCDGVFQNETGKNRVKTGAYLSTGFFTMILAMDMCDSISVYGMVDTDYCSRANHSKVPYHYYEQSKLSECTMYKFHERAQRGGHRFITEKAIYARWAAHHNVQFKHPSWRL